MKRSELTAGHRAAVVQQARCGARDIDPGDGRPLIVAAEDLVDLDLSAASDLSEMPRPGSEPWARRGGGG